MLNPLLEIPCIRGLRPSGRIPYERALHFANAEKITEILYPLFVHNIGALLYHPTNKDRTAQVTQAAERRKQELEAPEPSYSFRKQELETSSGRPSVDRAHTFPTPPTSCNSVMTAISAEEHVWLQHVQQSVERDAEQTQIRKTPRMASSPSRTGHKSISRRSRDIKTANETEQENDIVIEGYVDAKSPLPGSYSRSTSVTGRPLGLPDSPPVSPRILPQQQMLLVSEAFPQLPTNAPNVAAPIISISYAPPPMRSNFDGSSSLDTDAVTPPDRGKS